LVPDAAGVTAGERRRKQARERQALTLVATARETVFDRLDWQLARLRRELETAARFADQAEQTGAQLVRALLQGGKLHAVISDGKSTIEIMDGSVAVSVAQTDADGS
jgi:hypothetical protein